MTKQIKRKVNRDKLRALGVPEVLFEPAEYLTEQGAFEVEPPRELVESTITLCLEELKSSIKEGTSDVYCIPSRDAGEFSKKDVVVVGDLRVLSISKKPSTVHEAEQMLLESKKEDSTEALALRTRIEVLTHHALPVKSNGVLVGEFAGVLSADDSTAACETMLMTLNHAAGR